MNDATKIEKELKDISNNCTQSFNQSDQQTLFYFIQMIELLYTEVSYEVYDKDKLYDLICNNYRSNTNIVFSNMKSYYSKLVNSSINEFCKVVKVSVFNKYIKSSNLVNIYNNFKTEITTNTRFDNKIKVLSNSNGNLLLEQIHTNCVVNDSKKITAIVRKYVDLITDAMIKNIAGKNEVILSSYKSFIDSMTKDTMDDIEKIRSMNLKVINNTTFLYLKEQEYFVIDKYNKINSKLVIDFFKDFEEKVRKDLGIKKHNHNNIKFSNAKDYLLGFNNTIRVKAMKIFDEMNMAVTLDEGPMRDKVKEFNALISHIYELNLKFDKLFDEYKKEFNVPTHSRDKFDDFFDNEFSKLYSSFKTNISNIFRDNNKLYNDIVYKNIILRSRVVEFTEILSEKKVKDLLLQ